MLSNSIRVIRIDENTRKADVIYVENKLEAFYTAIDCGCIDMPSVYSRKYCVICDDEGIINGRPFTTNIDGYNLYGTILITKIDHMGECVTLEDDDIELLLALIGTRVSGFTENAQKTLDAINGLERGGNT